MTAQDHPSDLELAAFAAGTLDDARRIAVAAHIRGCARCRAFVRAMEHVGGVVLEGLPPAALAGGSLAEVLARLDKEANGEQAARVEAWNRRAGPPPSVGAAIHRKTQANPPWHNWALQAAAAMLL
ncbi:MAG: zf-HC2 domain-containing protein [Rhodoplanes sp.]